MPVCTKRTGNMQNIIEYLKWRGDITFEQQPICEADYLVFAQLAYMPYNGVVSGEFIPSVTIGEAAAAMKERISADNNRSVISYAQNMLFLQEICNSPRFCELYMCGYINIFSAEKQEQFSAVTFLFPDTTAPVYTYTNADVNEEIKAITIDTARMSAIIAFRGTDSTLIGWKEDFNMAFSDAVPAQVDAVNYLKCAAEKFPESRIYLCGHSKGGNLAVYASAFCGANIQQRITAVRSLDGPGFSDENINQPEFQNMLERTETIVPSSSIVGILLEHAEPFTVIKSYATSAPYQHDIFTWEISRCGYIPVEHITDTTRYIDATLSLWIKAMPQEMRKNLINGIFEVVSATGATDIRDIISVKNILPIMKAMKKLSPQAAAIVYKAISLFKSSAKAQLPQFIERLKETRAKSYLANGENTEK